MDAFFFKIRVIVLENKLKKLSLIALILSLSFVFIVHYAIIILKVGPINPLSVAVKQPVDTYTSEIFSQNWHLFAPEPVSFNATIYMQVDTGNNIKNDEWLDISSPLIEQNHNQIFTPFNRLVRIIDGLYMDANGFNQDDLTVRYLNKNENKNSEETKVLKESINKLKDAGQDKLYKYASAYAKSIIPEEDIKRIRVKLITTDPIPFSKRNDPNIRSEISSSVTYNWEKLDDKVVNFF